MKIDARIYGCWLGKSIGGTLGLPAEGVMQRLHYTYYDPVPETAPPNDDLELQLVWLHLVENAGSHLSQADFADAWLSHIHYMWDEYGQTRWNLRRGVPVESVGTFENHFHAGMGSPIRSEIWACLFAGNPDSAAHYAALDASLDHGVEGIAGEVFFAAMQSVVMAGALLSNAISRALSYIPESSATAHAIRLVNATYQDGQGAWESWTSLLAAHGNENFTYAPLNVALTVWALLHGGGDFEKSILYGVNGGYDTDCVAATVGATLGMMIGADGIPERWKHPIGEGVYVGPGILGICAPTTLGELTERTVGLIGKLEKTPWTKDLWTQKPVSVSLESLPGTLRMNPLDGAPTVHWANGELPDAVKNAGGAQWTWFLDTDEPREITCLAQEGARLYLNDTLLIECPPGLPYVPAPHRTAPGSRISVQPGIGKHRMRLELNSTRRDQNAALILTYPNFHLCPWTKEELPLKAILPALKYPVVLPVES